MKLTIHHRDTSVILEEDGEFSGKYNIGGLIKNIIAAYDTAEKLTINGADFRHASSRLGGLAKSYTRGGVVTGPTYTDQ